MSDVNDILLVAEKLGKQGQLTLLERLVSLIRKKENQVSSITLSSLSGTGVSVWSGINIDEYIYNERQW
jgi:hypothetical protein